MKRFVQAGLLTALLASPAVLASQGASWGYSGATGPEHWGELNSKFMMCSEGKNQSPIDITQTVKGELPAIHFSYKASHIDLLNNGHTVQINVEPGSYITVNNHRYDLKQLHFHSPSENMINGHNFPLEAHFVHADSQGNLAVVGVLFQEGAANKVLSGLWQNMPMHAGDRRKLARTFNPMNLIPLNETYYRFNGSLTTPPCSEGVSWMLLKAHTTISKEQVQKFIVSQKGHSDARPVQPLNARMVIE
ncbi:carbonic anhydrase [Celerinatantimonas yamalensis]|uniref:Carbonic anhydrase n=1 Tax=Celerinatantimonas yamalensis TaxID=559956 RepID=A0ABW9G8H7_9GAMM